MRWRRPRPQVATTWSFSWLDPFATHRVHPRRTTSPSRSGLAAEAGEWPVVATLSRQLDALRRECEGGGLKVIKGGSSASGSGTMSAEVTSLPSPPADGASSEPGRRAPIVGAGGRWVLHHGDALAVLRSMPDASVDAVITDPPYSSGGFTRGDRSMPPATKYTMNGTKIERPAFAGDARDQRSFAYRTHLIERARRERRFFAANTSRAPARSPDDLSSAASRPHLDEDVEKGSA